MNAIMRRSALIAFSFAWPPALALALLLGTRYGLAAAHRNADPGLLRVGFIVELALFYLAALFELKSRWTRKPG